MKAYLKVKIKSLAAEAVIIRHEERRIKAFRRAVAHRQGAEPQVERLGRIYTGLHEHRTKDVRDEARASNLAYAFIRKRPYSVTEPASSKPFSIGRVSTLVQKYGEGPSSKDAIAAELKAWMGQ